MIQLPSIDESIQKIDKVICRHLDTIGDSSRGVVSQDILEQLTKFVSHIMLKFYAKGSDIEITSENIEMAIEHAQTSSVLKGLYKFHNFLQVVTTQFTLDEDGSERLMLKYYQYLLEIKNLLNNYFGIQVLHNLSKFPLHLDTTLQEYYTKISMQIDRHPESFSGTGNNKYYIQKLKPLFVSGKIYYEVTFSPIDDRKNKSKSNRVIAFTKLPIISNYASKFHIIQDSIDILGKSMPINIIDGWEVSIRDCEFQNFISIIIGSRKRVSYQEQKIICQFITQTQHTLCELIDFPDYAYNEISLLWKNTIKHPIFIHILDQCRNLIQNDSPGHNILRYLLYNMNNVIIKNQHFNTENEVLSNLYLSNGCKQFDDLPFNRSPLGHNPKLNAIFECIPTQNRESEIFARYIKNNTEIHEHLFTDIDSIVNFKNINYLIKEYNSKLWFGHKPRSNLMLENKQVFINEYKIDTCKILDELKILSTCGVEHYKNSVQFWELISDYYVDSDEKKQILRNIFSQSKVAVIYGSAGVGKSTLINHISNYMNDKNKLYLTQTNPAKENLIQKINAENTDFYTITSFLNQDFSDVEHELLVIDECSTVSNRDMVQILEKANFNLLLLVGDTYQIDAIRFGNWFSLLKYFLPHYSVFELTKPYRTDDKHLLELWDKVRNMDEDVKEIIEKESYSLKVDDSLLSSIDPDEVILCLNYDGLYGINNINRFLQESNPNPSVKWDIQQYKVGDPILFLESDRFYPVIHNNLKGVIRGIQIIDKDSVNERIQFDIEIPKIIDAVYTTYLDFELLEYPTEDSSLIRFCVNKLKSADEDVDEQAYSTIVPFQIAYAVSIHKAQGLEYNSVKIVITDEVEELVTHNIFYTAITRARKKLKIYWTPETEDKVIKRIKPRDISQDVKILKEYKI